VHQVEKTHASNGLALASHRPAISQRGGLDSGDVSEDDEAEEACRRIALAARRLALGRQEDEDGEVSEGELEQACRRMGLAARRLALERRTLVGDVATEDEEEDSEEACARIRLAARRLALGRQEDEDGEVSEAELEAAADRMGMLARRYARCTGRAC